jgi:hypothetical protein
MTIFDLFRDPRKALLGQLTVYYGVLTLFVWQLLRWFPNFAAYMYSWEDREASVPLDEVIQTLGQIVYQALQPDAASALFVSIIGALLLMIPVSWVYIGTRRRSGLDQSMIESLLMLPAVVAGVVVIVQDNLALAFSLAGIFAGIQFRSRLKFYADAHFIFAAIGVGLAAGIGALHIAAVMSLCFNYIAYFIWRLGYGAESAERHLRFATEDARAVAQRRKDYIHRHGMPPAANSSDAEDTSSLDGSLDDDDDDLPVG